MTDLALDTKTHDMVFSLDDRGASIAFVVSGPAVVQKIKIRLLSFFGEWFLDSQFGTPWFEEILTKNTRSAVVESIIRGQILGVYGVDKIESLTLDFNRETRLLSVATEVSVSSSKLRVSINLQVARRLG